MELEERVEKLELIADEIMNALRNLAMDARANQSVHPESFDRRLNELANEIERLRR